MVAQLLRECEARGVRFTLSDTGVLHFSALPGAFDEPLRVRVRARRTEIAAHLAGRGDLALNALQMAYVAGQAHAVELGGRAPVYYLELDCPGLEAAALNAALAGMLADHPVLAMALTGDGSGQPALRTFPEARAAITETRLATAEARDALRRQMQDGAHDPRRWPLFDIQLSRVGDRDLRLHLLVNLILLDAHSGARFIAELLERTQGGAGQRPAITATRLRAAETENPAHRRWWDARLDDLPAVAALPLSRPLAQLGRPEYARLQAALTAQEWRAFREAAQAQGLTPSLCVCAALAETLARWAGQTSEQLISLTLFQRPGTHPDRDAVLGDFTNILPLACPELKFSSLADFMRETQDRLWNAAGHADCSGVAVLSDLARRRGQPGRAIAPVVFTSLLDDDANGQGFVPPSLTEICALSMTPQVALDCQVLNQRGALRLSWDHVTNLLDPAETEAAFTAFVARLRAMAASADWIALPLATAPLLPARPDAPRLGQAATETPGGLPVLDPARIESCWHAVLPGAPQDRAASFFDLGGSSLLAVRLQAALSQAAGCQVPIHVIFDNPTLGGLCRALSGRTDTPAPACTQRSFSALQQRRQNTECAG